MAGVKKAPGAATAGQIREWEHQAREQAKLNNETPPSVILGQFALVDLVEQNRHQWAMHDRDPSVPRLTALLSDPVSPGFAGRYGDRLHLLTQNKQGYDGPTEDALDRDPVIQRLIPDLRSRDKKVAAEATNAFRARRTVCAALGHVGLSSARPEEAPAAPPEVTLTVQLELDPAPTAAA